MPPDGRPGFVQSFQDPSGHVYNIPFEMKLAEDIIKALAGMISEEAKRELAPLFNGGLYLPNGDALKDKFKPGPQG